MKKCLFAIAGVALLSACSSIDGGYELYGNGQGGWNEEVSITDLQPTEYTNIFRTSNNDVVYFALDSYSLDDVAMAGLKAQAEWLKENPKALALIEGRCDERGTREYNLALGDRRANMARSYLVANGVEEGRIRTISYGKDKPVVLGSDEESWALNRSATTVAY